MELKDEDGNLLRLSKQEIESFEQFSFDKTTVHLKTGLDLVIDLNVSEFLKLLQSKK